MGTPEFAVYPLKLLTEKKYNIVGVITAPDKPAGRGRKLKSPAVKEYAQSKNIPVLQPTNLKEEVFLEELKAVQADLQIVVAFRMLPELVWNMPQHGTFNLHASLLPDYRGAAPINWAIMNGEKTTGVTTFFLDHKIDTGDIIKQREVLIGEDETAGELHDKLMYEGGKLVIDTVDAIITGNAATQKQEKLTNDNGNLHPAPKIYKEDCRIYWEKDVTRVYNHIRGLSPYPAAWCQIADGGRYSNTVKIFQAEKEIQKHEFEPGKIISDNREEILVAAKNGFIIVKELQLAGKKRLNSKEFLKGFPNIQNFHFL